MGTEPLPDSDRLKREAAEALEDIREGLASMARGEGIPIADIERLMREEFGIPEGA